MATRGWTGVCLCLCLSVQISSHNALLGDQRALLDVYVDISISNVLNMLLPPAAGLLCSYIQNT